MTVKLLLPLTLKQAKHLSSALYYAMQEIARGKIHSIDGEKLEALRAIDDVLKDMLISDEQKNEDISASY